MTDGEGKETVIALSEDNMLVGAAWYRLFTENQKGYGYVDSNTPEIGIAVKDDVRGNGIGTLLLKKLFETALEDGYTSLSLRC